MYNDSIHRVLLLRILSFAEHFNRPIIDIYTNDQKHYFGK